MTSSNGNIFQVTGPLCDGFTSSRWIPLTKVSEALVLVFSLICALINGWVNNHEVGFVRRHRAHYNVTVMSSSVICKNSRDSTFARFWNNKHWIATRAPLCQRLSKVLADDTWENVSRLHCSHCSIHFDTLRPGQNGRHFTSDPFRCILLEWNC